MRQSKRGRGQRIWLEYPAEVTEFPVPVVRKQQRRKVPTHKNLQIDCVQTNPHRFIVTDIIHDVEWLVEEGADRQLLIVESPDENTVRDTTVLAAIYRSWPQLKGR